MDLYVILVSILMTNSRYELLKIQTMEFRYAEVSLEDER